LSQFATSDHILCDVYCIVVVVCSVFTLGNNAYGQCGRKIVDNEEHRSVRWVVWLNRVTCV